MADRRQSKSSGEDSSARASDSLRAGESRTRPSPPVIDGARRARPIIFSASMVRAILAGRKTQTRRVTTSRDERLKPGKAWAACLCMEIDPSNTPCVICAARFGDCPYGAPGDRLFVRETLRQRGRVSSRPIHLHDDVWTYNADGAVIELDADHPSVPAMISWAHHKESDTCSPIHMPRWASRITLEVMRVRGERLHDISEGDARAEGVAGICDCPMCRRGMEDACLEKAGARIGDDERLFVPAYRVGWDSINGKNAPWSSNPFVWVVEFRRVAEPTEGACDE